MRGSAVIYHASKMMLLLLMTALVVMLMVVSAETSRCLLRVIGYQVILLQHGSASLLVAVVSEVYFFDAPCGAKTVTSTTARTPVVICSL